MQPRARSDWGCRICEPRVRRSRDYPRSVARLSFLDPADDDARLKTAAVALDRFLARARIDNCGPEPLGDRCMPDEVPEGHPGSGTSDANNLLEEKVDSLRI